MNNQVLRFLVLLLSFLANATIPAQQKDISKLIEERVKLVDGQMSFNTHGVTYNHGKAPQVNSRDEHFSSTLVDSSKNGYGAYYKTTNPLAYGVDEGYFAVYRQWITDDASHGIIGAAQSEDGENWFTSQELNSVYPNGDESPNLPTVTGTPQARYPSAGYTEGAKPTAIWNEYTNASFGGGSYGGYPLHTYNTLGMGEDAYWVAPIQSNAGCATYPCDPPDLWNGNAMLIPEGNSYKFLGAYSTWAAGEEKTYMITSSHHTNGYNLLNDPYVWTDDLEVTDDGDPLWYGAGYISTADYHINADGVGYMVQVGWSNLTDIDGNDNDVDLITDENQGIFYKMTDDYGDSWTDEDGFKGSGYHVIPDAVALRLTDSLYNVWTEEENEYYYHYGDSLWFEGDTTENGEYIPYLMAPGWNPFYTFEMQTDANGGLHIVFPTLRNICYDYNGGCDDNDGDGYADSLYSTWISGGSGIWHIYSPDPMSGEDNWTASLIFDMSADYEAEWIQSDIPTMFHDGDDDHLGTMQYFYPNITMSAESQNVMWFAVAGMSDYEYSADSSSIIPLDVDLYMAKSTDNGLHWSEAENVTNTESTGALTNLGYPSEAALESGVHLANQGMDESVGVFYQMMDPNVNTIPDNSGYEDYKNWIYVGIYGDDYMGPGDDNIAVLTVHEVDGALGTTVSVPVDIELLGVDISSAEIRFSGFQNQLEFLGLDTEETLIGDAGWEVEVNEQEDVLITASAGANNISGSGTLFRLKFDIPENSDEYFVPIYIIEAQLNEYTETIDFVGGGVHIQYVMYGDVSQNGDVSAYDAALVLKYLVGLEELDENQLLAADVTLDESVSALDASVILQYVTELIDGLPYDDGAALAGTGDINMEDGLFTPGELLEVPIYLANGENLLSFEIDVAYDPEIVSFETVDWSNMIEHFSIEENNESGLMRVAGSGSTPDGAEGVFGNLQVFVDGGFEGESFEISISTYRINENEPVQDVVATFTNSALGLDHNSIPEVFALHQNYPNPFNPKTTLHYDLPEDAMVNITIYDMMGRVVSNLVSSQQNAGYKSIQWDATNNIGQPVSAGLYLYTIQAGDFIQSKKMVLLK